VLLALALRRSASAADLRRTCDESHYRAWRRRELTGQLTRCFDPDAIEGLDVLDFGCGTGELSALLAGYRPRSITGVDIDRRAIERAILSYHEGADGPCRPRFLALSDARSVPIRSASIDLVCCFDVVEHLADMDTAARQWARVLRPGGRVWIWWSPWSGPYGHHLDSLIPLPWMHLLFSEASLFRVCAEVYDAPSFVPRRWDIDPDTGRRKPNKWRSTTSFQPFLNKLTRPAFERTVTAAGLRIARREAHGFSGSWVGRMTRVLLPIPALGECFVSYYVYELVR